MPQSLGRGFCTPPVVQLGGTDPGLWRSIRNTDASRLSPKEVMSTRASLPPACLFMVFKCLNCSHAHFGFRDQLTVLVNLDSNNLIVARNCPNLGV